MVKANITKHGFIIEGHANYDEYGLDIVCSAISALSQSVAYTLQLHCKKVKVQATNGWLTVEIEEPNEVSKVLLDVLIFGLRNTSADYPEHLEIRIQKGMI